MVLLFSATATAENLKYNFKYKRSDKENMNMHLRCNFMAIAIGLSTARIGMHASEVLEYFLKVWGAYSDKEMAEREDLYLASSNYQEGWVDGFFSTLGTAERNDIYYGSCEDDRLLFSLKAK
jgi:hypothetical protein